MRRGLLVLAATLVAASTIAGAAPARSADEAACTWGASSITAEWNDGRLVESEPATSGCIPR